MVQFECPRVIHSLESFTFGVHSGGVPFSLYAGKVWIVNKVEMQFAQIGFVDRKWVNLNAPGSYTLVSLTFRVHCGEFFSVIRSGKKFFSKEPPARREKTLCGQCNTVQQIMSVIQILLSKH